MINNEYEEIINSICFDHRLYERERERKTERERERYTSMGDFSTVNPVVFGLCLFVFLDSSSFSSFNSCTIIN